MPQRQARGAKNQKRSPTKWTKISSGCLTPAFSGAQKRAQMLHHPCILKYPQQRGTKSEMAASPLIFFFLVVGRVSKKAYVA